MAMTTMSPSRYRYVIEGITFGAQASIGCNFFAPASMLPLIMDEFQIDRTQAGLLTGVAALLMVFFMVPCSVMASRLGYKLTYGVGLLLMSATVLSPLAPSFPVLVALWIVYGIGVSMIAPQSPPILARWFPAKQLPMLNGANMLGQNVAVTITMATGGALAQAIGWRQALMMIGLVPLIFFFAWAFLGKEAPAGVTLPSKPAPFRELFSILRHRSTLLLGLLLMGVYGQNIAMNSWLPVFYNKVLGFPLTTAGFFVSLISLFGILGALLVGYLPVRIGLRRPFLIIPGMLLISVSFAAFATANEAIILCSAALFGLLIRIYAPTSMTLPMEFKGITPEQAGMSLAVAFSMGNFGSFVAPLMVGFLADRTGSYLPGLSIAALLSLSMVVCGYLLPETGPRAGVRRKLVELGREGEV
jgi:predicted MFS family arabinose efflux permease